MATRAWEDHSAALAQFKQAQKQAWSTFAPIEVHTTAPAASLVGYAEVRAGQRVLDVACGTGVVAVTAARRGALVTALDLTPELLERARENGRLAGVSVHWQEGDVEDLPFDDGCFEVVLSQFGHIFAPRPEVAVAEMLRVLKPGGTIAFSTWPPELYVGRSMALAGHYLPPPPPGVAPPVQWGEPGVIANRLGDRVRDLRFDRARMNVPALSPQHHRLTMERNIGPIAKLVEMLGASDRERLAKFRAEFDALAAEYWHDNLLRQDYLLTRATKV